LREGRKDWRQTRQVRGESGVEEEEEEEGEEVEEEEEEEESVVVVAVVVEGAEARGLEVEGGRKAVEPAMGTTRKWRKTSRRRSRQGCCWGLGIVWRVRVGGRGGMGGGGY